MKPTAIAMPFLPLQQQFATQNNAGNHERLGMPRAVRTHAMPRCCGTASPCGVGGPSNADTANGTIRGAHDMLATFGNSAFPLFDIHRTGAGARHQVDDRRVSR
jgi:hypothetical protein